MKRKAWIWISAGALGLLIWGIVKARKAAALAPDATSVDVPGAAGSTPTTTEVPAGLTPTDYVALPYITVTSTAPAGSGLTAAQIADRDAAAAHITAQTLVPFHWFLNRLGMK